jgi:hypothetical protein
VKNRGVILLIAGAVAAVAVAGVVIVLALGDDDEVVVSEDVQAIVSASESTPAAAAVVDETTVAGDTDFWTDERIARAIANPLDMTLPAGPGASAPQSGPRDLEFTRTTYTGDRTRPLGSTLGRVLMYALHGDGKYYEHNCTGTVVGAANRSTILTAGHCVREPGIWKDANGDGISQETEFGPTWSDWNRDGVEQPIELTPRQWYKEISFLPGYDNRVRTHGTWLAASGADGEALVLVQSGWNSSRLWEYDFAAFVVAPQSGKTVSEAVGGSQRYGEAVRAESPEELQSLGYPATAPPAEFTGHVLFVCAGTPQIGDSRSASSGTAILALGCDMTGGASGGPWLVNVGENGLGTVAAVNSYKYSDEPRTMLGPRFRIETIDGTDYPIGTNVVDQAGSYTVQP